MLWTISMLTVNADGHPIFQRMHKPGDEKRMVVILRPDDYDDWLTCSVEKARSYWRQWQGQLDAFPAPPAAGAVRSKSPKKPSPWKEGEPKVEKARRANKPKPRPEPGPQLF